MKRTRILAFLLSMAILSAMLLVSASAMLGDITNDNNVNSKDYMMLKRYVLGTFKLKDEQLVPADVNCDGKVNGKDYMMLKRVVLGTYSLAPADPVIEKISSAIDNKGEISTTFTTSYLGKEGVATVSFVKVNGVVSLHGHLDITSLGAVVEIDIPLKSVSEKYTFTGKATQTVFAFDISGSLVAKEYSMNEHTIDVKFKQTAGADISGMESALIPLCKTAMDEFLAQANDLLVANEVGVTIADLGFTTYYNELNPSFN